MATTRLTSRPEQRRCEMADHICAAAQKHLAKLVGVAGFEPATPTSRT